MVVKWVNQLIILLLFLDDKALRKQIMGIETDSTPLEEPKTPILVMHLQSILCSPVLNNLQQWEQIT
jgi:hypothetical protein